MQNPYQTLDEVNETYAQVVRMLRFRSAAYVYGTLVRFDYVQPHTALDMLLVAKEELGHNIARRV